MPTLILRTFKHDFISPKKHKPNTATAHMSYIMRDKAMTHFQAENMPDGGYGTRVYFDNIANQPGARPDGRIADKFMIALPPELSAEQRHEVIASFMEALGKGRISWCAAHHDMGKDTHNPHAHIIFKDADILTGRKVIGTTTNSKDVREAKEKGWKVPPRMTTRELRDAWCNHLNQFMEREGFDIRYDARTLKEMGIDRDPQIHVGPKASELDQKNFDFTSRDLQQGARSLPYSQLDYESRAQHNAHIIEKNRQRELDTNNRTAAAHGKESDAQRTLGERIADSRQQQEKRELLENQSKARKALYAEQAKDKAAQKLAHQAEKSQHEQWAKQLYANARDAAYKTVGEEFEPKWRQLRKKPEIAERADRENALLAEQRAARVKESELRVAQARPEKNAAWKAMLAAQEKARLDLNARHREEAATLTRQHTGERFAIDEKWRGFRIERKANSLEKRISASGGLVPQQSAAMATLAFRMKQMHKLDKRDTKAGANGFDAVPADPEAAMKLFLTESKAAHTRGLEQRAALNAERENNSRRAPSPKPRDIWGRGRPRKHFVNGIGQDIQNDLRQAIDSGRTLTDGERANAARDIKERLHDRDRKETDNRTFTLTPQPQKDQGKGRPGGGRGR